VRSLDTTGGLAAGQGGTVIVEPEPPFAVSMRGREDGNVPEAEPGGVVPALRTGQGGSGNPMVVTEDEPVFTVHNGDDTIWSEGVAQPVIASKGWPGAVTFRKSQRAHDADDCETWEQDDVANTLNAFENHNDRRTTHAIVEPIPVELRMATRTSGATGVGTPGTGFGDEGDPSYPVMASPPPAVQQELSVRRLTPLECERLQGFSDEWTAGQADSVRYKQVGNAVAVPCGRWIARRLIEVHAKIA
jgi:site-specific DNA-cytosine methylase